MAVTYNTLGSKVTIRSRGTTVTVGFNNAMAIVGGYDANNAAAGVSAGTAEKVAGSSEAANKFGESSELKKLVETAEPNGVNTIWCVAVPETTGNTESFSSTSSGTLSNTPIFDPNFNTEHDVTATDNNNNSIDVNIVYEEGNNINTPSGPDEINLNPITGEWEADASDTYDITYDYGDYGTAMSEPVSLDVRYVAVATENDSVESTLSGDLDNRATDFDFKRGLVGAGPRIDAASASGYTPSTRDLRTIEVAPAHGVRDNNDVRTVAAVGSLLASQPVDSGGSVLYDNVGGLNSYKKSYAPSEATDFDAVTAITRDDEIAVEETTSDVEVFKPIYQVEIVDLVAESFYETAKTFAGGPNFQGRRDDLEASWRRLAESYANARPPLLATGDGSQPYNFDVSLGSSDDIVDASIGIEPAPIMSQINLDIDVGEVVSFNGAST